MAGENLKVLTAENWDAEVLQASGSVIVDFWATWCPPCRMIAPAYEALAEEYAGKLTFGKLDTDAHSSIAQQYDVMTIPTFAVFRNGAVVEQLIGPKNKAVLKQFIDGCL
ncbi:MAG: thioredoxin [Peptococcaceae bacterium]|jgi:thioredoxin 1|nr:thioredoxin [Peptococcaceae bacterium]